jgi:hypothetical protein
MHTADFLSDTLTGLRVPTSSSNNTTQDTGYPRKTDAYLTYR